MLSTESQVYIYIIFIGDFLICLQIKCPKG